MAIIDDIAMQPPIYSKNKIKKSFVLSRPSSFPSFSPGEIQKMNSIAKQALIYPIMEQKKFMEQKKCIPQPILRIIPPLPVKSQL